MNFEELSKLEVFDAGVINLFKTGGAQAADMTDDREAAKAKFLRSVPPNISRDLVKISLDSFLAGFDERRVEKHG